MTRIQIIPDFFEDKKTATLSVLRLDIPDPVAGGNKIFKMKYNLEEMSRRGFSRLMTFGGAYSNHIAAVATTGMKNGFETIGIIRGDELTEMSNNVLKYASGCGMKFVFISREEYRRRNDGKFCEALLSKYGPAYLLPEGGSNKFAVKGCREILSEETDGYDIVFCPVGTGATMAGIVSSAKRHQEVIGIAVLNGKGYLEKEVEKHLENEPANSNWEIIHDYTFGGYGKKSPDLERFITEMLNHYELPLDVIYSGKTLFAIREMKNDKKLKGKRILFLHTGGYAFSASGFI